MKNDYRGALLKALVELLNSAKYEIIAAKESDFTAKRLLCLHKAWELCRMFCQSELIKTFRGEGWVYEDLRTNIDMLSKELSIEEGNEKQ